MNMSNPSGENTSGYRKEGMEKTKFVLRSLLLWAMLCVGVLGYPFVKQALVDLRLRNRLLTGVEITKIHDIQGRGELSPQQGRTLTIEGVVVADFQAPWQLGGFYVQEEDRDIDSDPATSEGIFVYNSASTVSVGDRVLIHGMVAEYRHVTELTRCKVDVKGSRVTLPAISEIDLPLPDGMSLESYESMRVVFSEALTVSQNYFQGRYGQVTLSAEGRVYQPTNIFLPGSADAIVLADENRRRILVLDDGAKTQNPFPIPYIGVENTLRAGDTVTGLTGMISYGPIASRLDGPQHYLLHPTEKVRFTRVNKRAAFPAPVGGDVKVAVFNVLNYFNGDGLGGGFPTSRGADTVAEFARQRDKIIAALAAIDADVIGLMEIENDAPPYSAIEDLVNGLNDDIGTATYSFINTEIVGGDKIRGALLYKPDTMTPTGDFVILDSSVDASFNSARNRPALAQTFVQKSNDEQFTVVVNHLKSKGSGCGDSDDDTMTGQGNCNLTRTQAARTLTHWLASDPSGSGDPDVLIIGDLNAYAMEDPIRAIREAGYIDPIERFGDAEAYSYIFDGQAGCLGYALASQTLMPQVSGATVWHINADEPSVIDYNTEYKSQDLYRPAPYRASDHDPLIVGLQLRRDSGRF